MNNVNKKMLKGDWKVIRGMVREHWSKLSENDLDAVAGERELLIGLLQSHYGESEVEIERQVREFEERYHM